ncbi:MAG: ThuA domain-containing protein [Planctomycetaceae bacterium]|nr:ThuA domain-containing protein [Planctomycetaceae bacterium]
MQTRTRWSRRELVRALLPSFWAMLPWFAVLGWCVSPPMVRGDDPADRPELLIWLDAAEIAAREPESVAKDAPTPVARWNNRAGGNPAAAPEVMREWLSTPPQSNAVGSAEQPDPACQPKLLRVGKHSVLRFDGEDDHFRIISSDLKSSSVTVFLVAAAHRNPGEFRGLLSANGQEQRDYESGFNIDLGPGPTSRLSQLNVEGRGFGGAQNLRSSENSFGEARVFRTEIDAAQELVRLSIDGQAEGQRAYKPSVLSLDQWTIGARFYTNGPGQHLVRGPVAADVAEVLVFRGILTETQGQEINKYLQEKYNGLSESLAATLPQATRAGVELVKVANPPLVQMLQSGFSVQELPLELTNINNVRYRHDGKLVTLGYNGDIHLLSDTDGDGLEDHASIFWKNSGSLRGPIGIVLTPPNDPKGCGVYVASKGKVSLIVDENGDDQADREVIVASGWDEIPQNVDAVGLALGPDGSLYFGLGTANYANGYLIDEQGKSHYDLASDRGTVQRVSPDFQIRETIATGIRFPIAFEFNHLGDLFCTEQEGATWLANGNPFDELLHIPTAQTVSSGSGLKHFGFPPRHPRHNPNVIDEPSTFDFGPQHQSTCGMVFNESIGGGPVFGPQSWQHNAIVCGESRGKIWRTILTKTPVGYVADSQLIACLQMLTVDACVSPRGDLIVACHSGPPDWGTGPLGLGKLFRVRMVDAEAARPVAAWAESPQEIRIAFDRPVDPLAMVGLRERAQVQFGAHVRAGDRWENLVPPYAVVQRQLMQPRFELPVVSASLTPDMRTLILNTSTISSRDAHAVLLDLSTSPTEVDFTANGVRATWQAEGQTVSAWEGYLPHMDLTVASDWLADSAEHASLWPRLAEAGTLSLESILDLRDLLRPAVQPGETLDFVLPPEVATFAVSSNAGCQLTAALVTLDNGRMVGEVELLAQVVEQGGRKLVSVTVPGGSSGWVRIRVEIPTSAKTKLEAFPTFWTAEDATLRPLPKHRFWMPWINVGQRAEAVESGLAADSLTKLGGSWGRGRQLFHSDQTQCYKCHRVGMDSGGEIGPDLGNLVHRDLNSVVRDIEHPSFSINPDYVGQVLELKDGRVLTGVLRTSGDQLLVGDSEGKVTEVSAHEVERMQANSKSIMPDKLLEKLSEEERRDLLTFLLVPAPRMPLDSPLPAPPIRTRAEVAAALEGSTALPASLRPLHIVLVDGLKDHGPGEHDYPAWQRAWTQLLRAGNNVTVSNAREFPSDEQLTAADAIIFFQKGSFDGQRPEKLDRFLAKGGGVAMIHWAVNGDDQVKDFARRIGFASWGGRIKYRHGPLTLDVRNHEHPIMRNFEKLQLYDESYWELTGDDAEVTVLATSTEDGVPTPQVWVREHAKGRVFVSIPGHYNWTFDDPLFRILFLRGIAWTIREPIDRFNELVPLGARMGN